MPIPAKPRALGCWSCGSGNCDADVEDEIVEFLASPGGWLILNMHGLDSEGWGPLSTNYIDDLLKRLIKIKLLDVIPTVLVLKKYIS